MDSNSIYYKQVKLLIGALPAVAEQPCFALKGGTAINLFIRDLPRLSVDIDLTYIKHGTFKECAADITRAMQNIQQDLQDQGLKVTTSKQKDGTITRLIVSNDEVQIKIETTPVLRETVNPPTVQAVQPNIEAQFGFAEINMLDFNDLYAGKLCAALDRQHPRDLFDVKLLLENEGITETLKNTFLVYLISHSRPMAELLQPNRKALQDVFTKEFESMTSIPVSVQQLEETREQMIAELHDALTSADKAFLLDIKRSNPDWSKFYYPQAQQLPAVAWKLVNLDKMSSKAKMAAHEKLEKTFMI